MALFVLIHGAWHGAWCWKYVTEELEKKGHKVIAPNLPIDTKASVVDYAQVVIEAIGDETGVNLVGHSMAGLVLPLVAEKVLTNKLIYLCGVIRRAGSSLAQDTEDGVNPGLTIPGFENVKIDEGDGFSSLKREAIPYFYADCSAEMQEWAYGNLRKQHTYWNEENPQEVWPEVPAVSIICTEDRAIDPAWSEQIAKNWLGVTPIKLAGSHSPFLSRPKELVGILTQHI